MLIIKTQKEFDERVVDGRFYYDGDVKFECDIDSSGVNIDAENIDARNINVWEIDACDIDAWGIDARNINARNISYYAVCFAHQNINCESIKGRHDKSKHFCLDGKITIKPKHTIVIDGKTIELSEESFGKLKESLIK